MDMVAKEMCCSYQKVCSAVYEINKQQSNFKTMESVIKIKNDAEVATIDIEGTIGLSESWQFDNPESRVATYERFKECVAEIADIRNSHIVVNIRSTGGDVNDALLIYEALRSTGALVTTRCYGYTASAATIVAQAASPGCREMASTALYLVHQSLCSTEGNADELQAEVEMLRQTDRRIAEVYAMHSERSVDDVLELMAANGGRGKWLSVAEAIAEGLVDKAIGEEQPEQADSVAERTRRGVKALLRSIGIVYDEDKPHEADDINYISRSDVVVENSFSSPSRIALDEGQKSIVRSHLKATPDPSPVELSADARSRAYDLDAQLMKMR
jgi:ATP-dependent protease ClpP protease subunit